LERLLSLPRQAGDIRASRSLESARRAVELTRARARPPVDPRRGRARSAVEAKGDFDVFVWPAGVREPRSLRSTTFPRVIPLSAPGELVLDPVAIGLRVHVESWLDEYASAFIEGDGPGRAGETAVLTLRLGQHGPIVTGRLVGDGGAPIAFLGTVRRGRTGGRAVSRTRRHARS
jgi:hypothetical protein